MSDGGDGRRGALPGGAQTPAEDLQLPTSRVQYPAAGGRYGHRSQGS